MSQKSIHSKSMNNFFFMIILDQDSHLFLDNIIMVFVFFSFETIEIAYTDAVDATTQVVISQKNPGVYQIVKDGVKLQRFLNHIAEIKDQRMLQQTSNLLLESPIFVCLTAKGRKISQPVLQLISPTFQKNVLYVKIDKNEFKELPFNRSTLVGKEICYGQGFPQLRQKQEIRMAVFSLFSQQITNLDCIFIEKNANEIKELQKEGFQNIITQFSEEMFQNALIKTQNPKELGMVNEQSQAFKNQLKAFPFAEEYLRNLYKINKQNTVKQIFSFDLKKLSAYGFLEGLFRQSIYYNISPKSWVPHKGSKQTSAYIFHNTSNMQLYLAKASKLKEFTNEEQYEVKVLAYYLSMIINPSAYAVPQDKLTSLMKFCKIKSYQNKRAFFNVRPYIEGLKNLNQLGLSPDQIIDIFKQGEYNGQKVNGMGGFLLTSLIINDHLNVKTLCQQSTFLSVNNMENTINLLNSSSLRQNKHDIHICRTDFYSVLDLSNYKQLNDIFVLTNKNGPIRLSLKEIHPTILEEMKHILFSISDQKLQIIKSLIIYYRWNTKLVNYYEVITYRLKLIQQALKEVSIVPIYNKIFLLDELPQLACLLLKEDYKYFLVPSNNIYSPIEYTYELGISVQKQAQNPYAAYLHKACSFAIHHISFPILTFLQWAKSTNRYQVIEYMSMINHSFEDYVVMDKRLKLLTVNQKKNAILIIDHAELCQSLINRPKSIKTVMILRLRKINQIDDVGMISADIFKKENFKQSDDELINVLARQGVKKFNKDNQYYFYEWIFRTYVKIKCNLYNLDYNTALKFTDILHKAITTNCHRLKQIKQNHPNLYVYLYVLPVIKDNQKVTFNYRLFEYFHMYNLFDKILSNRWNFKLQTYQNSSVTHWRSLVTGELVLKLGKSLINCLSLIQAQENQSFYGNQLYNDCLQIIRTITEPRNSEDDQLLASLYYRVFVQHINVKNYNKIKDVQSNQSYVAVGSLDSIEISSLESSLSALLPNDQNHKILSFSLQQNGFIYVLKRQSQALFIQKVKIVEQMGLSFNIQQTFNIKKMLLKNFSSQTATFLLRLMEKVLCIIIQQTNSIILFVISISQPQNFCFKQYLFDEQLIGIRMIDKKTESYLICVTNQSLYTIEINDPLQETPTLLRKLPIKISKKTNFVFVEHQKFDIEFLLSQSNSLEIISIASKQVINTTRFQLPKPIKSLTLSQEILFVFHQAEDSLFLYKIKENSLQRIWRYFWVESNGRKLFVNGSKLLIIGGSYLKKIQLRNIENLSNLTGL